MARTILITIDDNKVAAQFAKDLATAETDGMPSLPQGARLDAMVARPTLACHCTPARVRAGRHGARVMKHYKLVEQFGWLVCPWCNRPEKAVVDNFISNRICGLRDLLPRLISGRVQANKHVRETEQAVRGHEVAS